MTSSGTTSIQIFDCKHLHMNYAFWELATSFVVLILIMFSHVYWTRSWRYFICFLNQLCCKKMAYGLVTGFLCKGISVLSCKSTNISRDYNYSSDYYTLISLRNLRVQRVLCFFVSFLYIVRFLLCMNFTFNILRMEIPLAFLHECWWR
jgi:hypothetical protein